MPSLTANEGGAAANSSSSASILTTKSLMRKLKRKFTDQADENRRLIRRVRKLERRNMKITSKLEALKRKLEQGSTGEGSSPLSTVVAECRHCHQTLEKSAHNHSNGRPCKCCIRHEGIFYAVEEIDERELDSDSETFGMWNCCEKEERDAPGCVRAAHEFE